ncbi:MBL fold metallo-hydrolase [Candidatus Falkowbacteria bacterium RIFOXYB2_FULL_34_18]|uniref:MBL fold metallo-hydrolase n=1 Tax=Candidatus Falkowbacteria bacterium RIFOXYD2_FULL_34_120 TaxID=1798007 RepID=A0A1F5TRB4_9BACT|nr:MAG: MBL fold metallo-hydrolase [Candidatus Falkowbacteria bacterium RIFOXYB2_FULL_34_18]OGF29986.1 MAG: MBL fold metallo-hydrolase [Candidatus Falkowbacteria bacterium RIFOXYC12_FULL_34_55]OGF37157.1 MAG: MBL fold metallo-hydrolase [Candidatus Falkowbacteria bacterium RIFOXYC2_FULL_34_220]OGF39522.1 MAG: MBL fold metallo-hydrolase [Candidatus Falkowbacteria bacterium RIFOXYD12_FULL_34_57]OGF41495.1 MAG: MBL fold metallo-hydrolase [Candidatus Falkowbacteria bacterium RIFOXYD2_FULL_34_120]
MEIKRLVVGQIETNCYILISNSEMAVIDPGDEAERIISEFKKHSAKLKYIIHTHYHYDHCLATEDIKRQTGAVALIHKNDQGFVENFIPDQYLSDGDFINIGEEALRVVLTPGHTRGSICLFDRGGRFIFTGDTLFFDGYGRTDLPGGDEVQMERSLAMLKELIKSGMKVYPGHGDLYIV